MLAAWLPSLETGPSYAGLSSSVTSVDSVLCPLELDKIGLTLTDCTTLYIPLVLVGPPISCLDNGDNHD